MRGTPDLSRRPRLPHIPRRIVLGEYIIPIVQLDRAEYAVAADEDDVPPAERSGGHWDDEERCLYLDRSLSLARRWRIVRHELQHVLADLILHENGGA